MFGVVTIAGIGNFLVFLRKIVEIVHFFNQTPNGH